MSDPADKELPQDHFYLPNFCAPSALLAVVLLACIAVLYPIYQRFAGAGGMRLG